MTTNNVRVAVFVSGGGSNLEAILVAQDREELGKAQVVLVISSKAGVQALERATSRQIQAVVVERKTCVNDEEFEAKILNALNAAKIDVVCLAGYLKKIGPSIIQQYQGRILNVHPALLPKYGGAGMYGHFVHEAVIKAGEKESGVTVHLVDNEFDHGPVLAQAKVPVLPNDSGEQLAQRVLAEEHKLYPKVLADFCQKLKR